MADDTDFEPIVKMLALVLRPLGEKAAEVLAWVDNEAKTRPIVSYCANERDMVWQLGELDPLAPDGQPRTIFAMLEVEDRVVVFAFEEQNTPDGPAIQFHRDVVYNPTLICGPLNHEALFRELRAYLTGFDPDDPDLPEHQQVNGRA